HADFRLLEPDEGDAEHLHALFSNEAITQYIPAPPSSVDAWRTWIAKTGRRADVSRAAFAVLTRRVDREVVGLLQIAPSPDEPGAWMWGVALAEHYWGTGLFAAVAAGVRKVADTQLDAIELKAWIAADNERAIRAFGKLPDIALEHVHDALC